MKQDPKVVMKIAYSNRNTVNLSLPNWLRETEPLELKEICPVQEDLTKAKRIRSTRRTMPATSSGTRAVNQASLLCQTPVWTSTTRWWRRKEEEWRRRWETSPRRLWVTEQSMIQWYQWYSSCFHQNKNYSFNFLMQIATQAFFCNLFL